MCGRYHVDEETMREIKRLVQQIEGGEAGHKTGDICPSDTAPVLSGFDGRLCCQVQKWGIPSPYGKQLIINARRETALEKPSFREGLLHRRTAVPAAWFYEWNQAREKNICYRKEKPVLFMAGCWNRYEDGDHFVILTASANTSIKPIHDRMPMILEREEIADWLLCDDRLPEFLQKELPFLERRTDYEQLNLFS